MCFRVVSPRGCCVVGWLPSPASMTHCSRGHLGSLIPVMLLQHFKLSHALDRRSSQDSSELLKAWTSGWPEGGDLALMFIRTFPSNAAPWCGEWQTGVSSSRVPWEWWVVVWNWEGGGGEGNLGFLDSGDGTGKSLEVGRVAQGLLTRQPSGCEGWRGFTGGRGGRSSRKLILVVGGWKLVTWFLTYLSPKFGTTVLK